MSAPSEAAHQAPPQPLAAATSSIHGLALVRIDRVEEAASRVDVDLTPHARDRAAHLHPLRPKAVLGRTGAGPSQTSSKIDLGIGKDADGVSRFQVRVKDVSIEGVPSSQRPHVKAAVTSTFVGISHYGPQRYKLYKKGVEFDLNVGDCIVFDAYNASKTGGRKNDGSRPEHVFRLVRYDKRDAGAQGDRSSGNSAKDGDDSSTESLEVDDDSEGGDSTDTDDEDDGEEDDEDDAESSCSRLSDDGSSNYDDHIVDEASTPSFVVVSEVRNEAREAAADLYLPASESVENSEIGERIVAPTIVNSEETSTPVPPATAHHEAANGVQILRERLARIRGDTSSSIVASDALREGLVLIHSQNDHVPSHLYDEALSQQENLQRANTAIEQEKRRLLALREGIALIRSEHDNVLSQNDNVLTHLYGEALSQRESLQRANTGLEQEKRRLLEKAVQLKWMLDKSISQKETVLENCKIAEANARQAVQDKADALVRAHAAEQSNFERYFGVSSDNAKAPLAKLELAGKRAQISLNLGDRLEEDELILMSVMYSNFPVRAHAAEQSNFERYFGVSSDNAKAPLAKLELAGKRAQISLNLGDRLEEDELILMSVMYSNFPVRAHAAEQSNFERYFGVSSDNAKAPLAKLELAGKRAQISLNLGDRLEEDELILMSVMYSNFPVGRTVVVSRADPAVAAAGAGQAASFISHLSLARKMPSTSHLAALAVGRRGAAVSQHVAVGIAEPVPDPIPGVRLRLRHCR